MHDDRMGDGMNISTVNELIASLESAGELSIKERKYLELAKAYQQLAAENVALKRVPETDSVAMLLALDSFRSESLPDVGLQKAFESLMYHRKTPATDRIYAEIKADAIDEAAVELDRVDTVASTRVIGFKLREFAKQLREGADK
ncbi:TPA: hypothetical protein NEG33_003436 [Klebsiella pneumoniae]|nr:hypothetical protein [Klebsiella pneumoniae]HDU5468259.1 hypothetical protein [Klebsiella pneumoniae subsp. pneumoniae]MCK4189122.1 hypothetical protein [Klebsiella pneumoniae]MCY0055641.1 hypothetical protein [Klebsiella pneumoniae]HBQ1002308.1 hypothetical protein [Klebsiella pneumoniae]HBR6052723.1 hypothetical protein [Klebsiella pneumoniae]